MKKVTDVNLIKQGCDWNGKDRKGYNDQYVHGV